MLLREATEPDRTALTRNEPAFLDALLHSCVNRGHDLIVHGQPSVEFGLGRGAIMPDAYGFFLCAPNRAGYGDAMTDPTLDPLVAQARDVAAKAYAPASNFHVGAVLVAEDGQVFTGCNVENASYGLTICAERAAVCRAVAEGAQKFTRCVIFTDTAQPTYPCGACRQVLAEFGPDMEIVIANSSGIARQVLLRELLPEPFLF